MTTYLRTNVSIPLYVGSIPDPGAFDAWRIVSFVAGPTDTMVHLNDDGTFTRLTGTGFAVSGSGPDAVPTGGVVSMIEHMADSGGTTIYATYTGLPPGYSLTTHHGLLLANTSFIGTVLGGDDTLTGGTAEDILRGAGGNDSMSGGGGRDVLDGGLGTDTMDGGIGGDVLRSLDGQGPDTIIGGEDHDHADIVRSSLTTAISADLSNPSSTVLLVDGTSIVGVESIWLTGGLGNDTLTASASTAVRGDNRLFGGGGADRLLATIAGAFLEGQDGNDSLVGSTGYDLFQGGLDDDVIQTGGNPSGTIDQGDFAFGGYGDDTITATGSGNLQVWGDLQTRDPNGGNDLIDVSAAGAGFSVTIYGGGGADTIIGSAGNDNITGDDGIGGIIASEIGNHEPSHPTNDGADSIAGGAGDDMLVGGGGDDTLHGGEGNDTFLGQGGNDSMVGGSGNDSYDYADPLDNAIEFDGEGIDTVNTIISVNGLNGFVENLIYRGTGDFLGVGNSSANQISGAAGNDTLDGAGGDDALYGDSGNDNMTGGQGNDTLDGWTGDDNMTGGIGDDTYYYMGLLDNAIEFDNEGTDTVFTRISVNGLNGFVENLIYTESADFLALGNASANSIVGGAGNDTLDGAGGTDRLEGNAGDDTYLVEAFTDVIVENLDEGTDIVISSDSYIFHDNVENASLTGGAGNGVIGNDLANTITGNFGGNGITGGLGKDTIAGDLGNDTIDGGAGDDSMAGGAGSDVYFVDAVGDVVVDEPEVGVFDIVWTIVTMTLPVDVEILILNGGNLAINGTGNDGATDNAPNLMLGNNAVNVLTTFGGDDIILGLGGNDTITTGAGSAAGVEIIAGGIGNDTLTSGGGHDFFTFENISEAGDTITDFGMAGNDLDILDLRPMFFPTFTNLGGVTNVAQAVTSGHLTFMQVGADTHVLADADGGGNNNVLLALLNNTTAATVQILTLI